MIHRANIATIQGKRHVYRVLILISISIHTKVNACLNVTQQKFYLFLILSHNSVLVSAALQDILKDFIATIVVQLDTIPISNNVFHHHKLP